MPIDHCQSQNTHQMWEIPTPLEQNIKIKLQTFYFNNFHSSDLGVETTVLLYLECSASVAITFVFFHLTAKFHMKI